MKSAPFCTAAPAQTSTNALPDFEATDDRTGLGGGGMDQRDERGEAPEANYSLQRFSETRAAYAVNVPALRHAVVAFAEAQGATPMVLGSIGQAVGEALNSIVIHASRDDLAPGSMTVAAHRELAHLAVVALSCAAADTSDRPGTIVLMTFALS
jgi:hypothetical protein